MPYRKSIQDNDNTCTPSFMVFDSDTMRFFQHRFVLLRGNKLTSKQIKELRPQLFDDPNYTVEYWKLAHRYFVIDLLTNTCLLHCEYVKKGSKGYLRDLRPFASHAVADTVPYAVNAIAQAVKHEKGSAASPADIILHNVYCHENKWFLITYNYLNVDKFIINPRAFVDFGKYFTRQATIDRILHILELEHDYQ